ncbi:MAG: hypothetical protein IT169_15155, partial [Bryobacterales bacterium]|nr:hypothetical protein [Bryobacterales bacterium]
MILILLGPPLFFVPYYGLTAEWIEVVLKTWAVCIAVSLPLWIRSLIAGEPDSQAADDEIPLSLFPSLQAEVAAIARAASRPSPITVHLETPDLADELALLPKQFAVFPKPNCLCLPVGPLALWSLLDLRSHIL